MQEQSNNSYNSDEARQKLEELLALVPAKDIQEIILRMAN